MIAARDRIAAPPEAVFAFLADLANHWRLLDRGTHVDVLEDGAGATVRLRGPLGVQRTARTRVLRADGPRALDGEARIGRRTVGRVHWDLAPDGDGGTLATLTATVPAASLADRLLLAAGGRRWLRARFADALVRLAAEATAAPVTMSSWDRPPSPAASRWRTSPPRPSARPAPRGSASR